MFNPSHSNPGPNEKINLTFYLQTLLSGLNKFNECFYGVHKTFQGTNKKGENLNSR